MKIKPAMEESEHDVKSLEWLELNADENYLAVKLPLKDNLGKVPEWSKKVINMVLKNQLFKFPCTSIRENRLS